MKKLLVLSFAVILAFTFISCKNNNETTNIPTNTTTVDMPQIDFVEIMNGRGGNTILSECSEAVKQEIIRRGNQQGITVSFDADGNTTFKKTGASTMIQDKNGTWKIDNGKGQNVQLGGNLPDNELTRLLPQPDFKIVSATSNENRCIVNLGKISIEQVRDYAEKCKNAGFNINPVITDSTLADIQVYDYKASNTDGYTVEVGYTESSSVVTISKP